MPPPHQEVLGESPAFLDFQDKLRLVAPVQRPVLLQGERGTGKEMAARRLHFLSSRWGEPFIPLNCAALAPSLIESELFGHEAGAFTGARQQRKGRFEAAHGGTLFLDEISLIPRETQEKILRVVEYGVFERVGGNANIEVDVRIIGASNVNLQAEAEAGRFKADLLDRLAFEALFIPPLRHRPEDILLLARHFAARMAHELDRAGVPLFDDSARQALLDYGWPGNIRELKNVVERAVYQSEGESLEADSFNFHPFRSPWQEPVPIPSEKSVSPTEAETASVKSLPDEGFSLPDYLREAEVQCLRQALEQSRYNQKKAARLLGLSYHQFRGLYRKHENALKG